MSTEPAKSGATEVSISELLAIVELVKSALTDAQYTILKAAILTLGEVVTLLQSSRASIQRMRRLFANASESTRKVLARGKGKKKTEEKENGKQEVPQEPEKDKTDNVEGAVSGEGQKPPGSARSWTCRG